MPTPFKRVMAANRGEIAIRIFRACTELGIQTIAIYSEEDRLSLHRYKADEAWLIGKGKKPIDAYLGIDEIVDLARRLEVDAIHPGYGFLSENPQFSEACERAGIVFIGPTAEMQRRLGDKVAGRKAAESAGVPIVPGTPEPIVHDEEALVFARRFGYPIIIKASAGGGGRGMRVARSQRELVEGLVSARSEAQAAFGNPAVFLERYIERPKHIEVQLLGDHHGNLVHLFERDCSIQRRHQKVVESAPSLALTERQRTAICEDALRIGRSVSYRSAGTVEFLVDQEGRHYFIEVNPRIQVEHTVTESITGRNLVQAQLLVAQGKRLSDPEIGIARQEDVQRRGFAIQCRITTEDPQNGFAPDYGVLAAYRSPGGFGVRLDAGSAFGGAVITPHYDSLLVKVTTWGLTHAAAAHVMDRSLQEFRVRGVKTNISFLENVMRHPIFLEGQCDTSFIEAHPELLQVPQKKDRGTKLLRYLAEVVVNGQPGVTKPLRAAELRDARVPKVDVARRPPGTRDLLLERGPEGSRSGSSPRSGCSSPTRRCATRTSRSSRHASARTTSCGSRRRRACTARGCSPSSAGAARRSTCRCGSSRRTRGSGSTGSARRSRTSSSRCSSGARTRSATRTTRTTWSSDSSRRRRGAASTCSASSTRSTGRRG
jgi:pyruvate carboxylase